MNRIKWASVLAAAGLMLWLAAPSHGQGLGGPVVEPPRLAGDDAVKPDASVTADPEALAALAKEEAALEEEGKELTTKIVALAKPLLEERQRMVSQDRDLASLAAAIAGKQKELDARIVEEHPEIATNANERAQWDARQKVVKRDPDLMAMTKSIGAKQKELEVAIAAKYPQYLAQSSERDQLTRQVADVNGKLREIRRKMDATQEAIKKQEAAK